MASPREGNLFISLSLSLFQKAKKSAFLLLLFSRVIKGKKESAGTTLSRFSYLYIYIYSRRASYIYITRKDYYILVTTTTRRLDFCFCFFWVLWVAAKALSFERFTTIHFSNTIILDFWKRALFFCPEEGPPRKNRSDFLLHRFVNSLLGVNKTKALSKHTVGVLLRMNFKKRFFYLLQHFLQQKDAKRQRRVLTTTTCICIARLLVR